MPMSAGAVTDRPGPADAPPVRVSAALKPLEVIDVSAFAPATNRPPAAPGTAPPVNRPAPILPGTVKSPAVVSWKMAVRICDVVGGAVYPPAVSQSPFPFNAPVLIPAAVSQLAGMAGKVVNTSTTDRCPPDVIPRAVKLAGAELARNQSPLLFNAPAAIPAAVSQLAGIDGRLVRFVAVLIVVLLRFTAVVGALTWPQSGAT